eukprot:6203813-Pleurochrysis_carterae.AAC.2
MYLAAMSWTSEARHAACSEPLSVVAEVQARDSVSEAPSLAPEFSLEVRRVWPASSFDTTYVSSLSSRRVMPHHSHRSKLCCRAATYREGGRARQAAVGANTDKASG